jgi:hypothetical protein
VDTGPHSKPEKGNAVKYRGFKKPYEVCLCCTRLPFGLKTGPNLALFTGYPNRSSVVTELPSIKISDTLEMKKKKDHESYNYILYTASLGGTR